MGCSKTSSKREVYSDKCVCEEKRNILNKQPNFTSQETENKKKRAN